MGRGTRNIKTVKAVAPPSPDIILQELHSLPPETFNELQAELQPRRSAQTGFLAKDEKLLPLLQTDVAALAEHNLTPQQVGNRLQEVLFPHADINYRRSDKLRRQANIPQHLEVRLGGFTKGFQECPFTDCGCCNPLPGTVSEHDAFGGSDFVIINTNTKEKIKGPGLLPHLVTRHNFFEGHIKYRVDPVQLARVLEMIPADN